MPDSLQITKRKFNKRLSALGRHILLLGISLVSIYPLYYMATNAFKTRKEFMFNEFGLPINPVLVNFKKLAMVGNVSRWFLNSTILSVSSVFFSMFFASLAAYALSVMDFKGKQLTLNLIIPLMALPAVVMVVPLFLLYIRMGLVNNYFGPIIIYIGLNLPFSVYFLYNYFVTLPLEVMDAARIDGCTGFQLYWRIVLPMSAPALVSLISVSALWVWNDLLFAIVFLQDASLQTVMVGTSTFQNRFTINIPVLMAGLLVVTLPMIIVYVIGQRYFIRGLVAGALKG